MNIFIKRQSHNIGDLMTIKLKQYYSNGEDFSWLEGRIEEIYKIIYKEGNICLGINIDSVLYYKGGGMHSHIPVDFIIFNEDKTTNQDIIVKGKKGTNGVYKYSTWGNPILKTFNLCKAFDINFNLFFKNFSKNIIKHAYTSKLGYNYNPDIKGYGVLTREQFNLNKYGAY